MEVSLDVFTTYATKMLVLGVGGKLAPVKILHPSVLPLNFSKKQKKEDIHIYREKRVNLNILKEKTGHIPYLNDLL